MQLPNQIHYGVSIIYKLNRYNNYHLQWSRTSRSI